MDGTAEQEGPIFRALARALGLAAALVAALWFLNAILGVLLIFAFIAILAIALNPAVTWLEGRRVPRAVGTLLILGGLAVGAGLLGWLVVPRLVQQLADLTAALPGYAAALADRIAAALADYPAVERRLRLDADAAGRLLPTLSSFLTRVGRYTLSAIGALVLGVALAALIGVPLGLAVATLLPRELEGTLAIIGVVGIEMSLPAGAAPAPFLPLYGPVRLLTIASGDDGAIAPALLHGLAYGIGLFAAAVLLWTRRVRLQHPPGSPA